MKSKWPELALKWKGALGKYWYALLVAAVGVLLMAGAGLLLMAASVCKTLIPVWSKRQDYSFGYLTPLFVLYVLFDRKEKIAEFFEKRREKSAPIGAV